MAADTIDLTALQAQFAATHTLPDAYQVAMDAPYAYPEGVALLFLGFMCLFILDEKTDEVYLAAASNTEHYRLAIHRYGFKESEYRLKVANHQANPVVKATMTGEIQCVDNWGSLSREEASADAAQVNQASSGIGYSEIQPLTDGVRGAIMYNFYQFPDQIGDSQDKFMAGFTKLVLDYLRSCH